MDNSSPVSGWNQVDSGAEEFFSSEDIYDLGETSWSDYDLEGYKAVLGLYGGCVSIMRDPEKVMMVTRVERYPIVRMFTASGNVVGKFEWTQEGPVGWGWSAKSALVMVDVQGKVYQYNLFGDELPTFSLGLLPNEESLLRACVYPKGIIGLTDTLRLLQVNNDESPPKVVSLPLPHLTDPPTCMEVVPSSDELVEETQVLMGLNDGRVCVVDSSNAFFHQFDMSWGPVSRMCPSPGGFYLAVLFEQSDILAIVSLPECQPLPGASTFVFTDFDLIPEQMCWCGNDAVGLLGDDHLLLYTLTGNTLQLDIDSPGATILAPECDGLRVIDRDSHKFICKVPQSLQQVFILGSTHPGAKLFDARKLYNAGSATADMQLRELVSQNKLKEAVHTCIDAAGEESQVFRQEMLLTAAVYGRAFLGQDFNSTLIYNTALYLKIINQLRDPVIGIPITLRQLNEFSLEGVIQRLIGLHHHLLALRICESRGLSAEVVYLHWARAKIAASQQIGDDRLREEIEEKLQNCIGIRYASLAKDAKYHGRRKLAAELLEHEQIASEQVPLLVELGDYERALRKALVSGDTDLAYWVIFTMYKQMQQIQQLKAELAQDYRNQAAQVHLEELQKLPVYPKIESFEGFKQELRSSDTGGIPWTLFEKFCYAQGQVTEMDDLGSLLRDLHTREGNLHILAEQHMRNAINLMRQPGSKTEHSVIWNEVTQHLNKGMELYPKGSPQQTEMEQFRRLRSWQAKLEASSQQKCYVGLPLIDTLRQCVKLENYTAADDLVKVFRIPDKTAKWVKLNVLASTGRWGLVLKTITKEHKPRSVQKDFEPFISLYERYNASRDVFKQLIDMMPDGERKVELYSKFQFWDEVAQVTMNMRDKNQVAEIRNRLESMVDTATVASQTGIKNALEKIRRWGGNPQQ
eukprot:TRINITY_DN6424_c1_g1_i6.p1 TRINITY_DN6424_c1_g1~~TRINITY_DN6424_c1_g1_i6.p1  ORF type:complete len:917 (+),score=120.78 TRINITY_DN6424_c1_g1_i6:66-2816(+)